MMGKYLTVGMLGFWMGMKCKESGKNLCVKQLKKQAMKKLGL